MVERRRIYYVDPVPELRMFRYRRGMAWRPRTYDPSRAGLYAADDLGTVTSVLAGDVLDSVSDVLSDLE